MPALRLPDCLEDLILNMALETVQEWVLLQKVCRSLRVKMRKPRTLAADGTPHCKPFVANGISLRAISVYPGKWHPYEESFHIPELQEFYLKQLQMTNELAQSIAKSDSLQLVNLESVSNTSILWSRLPPTVETLQLERCDINSSELRHLQLPRLKKLVLRFTNACIHEYESIAKHPSLTSLTLTSTSLFDTSVFQNLVNLRHLDVENVHGWANCMCFEPFTQLRDLSLKNFFIDDAMVESLSTLRLETLKLDTDSIDSAKMVHICKVATLQNLELAHATICESDIALPTLTKLSLLQCKNVKWEHAGEFPNLERVVLSNCNVSMVGARKLAALPSLKRLVLKTPHPIEPRAFAGSQLRALWLHPGDYVAQSQLGAFSECPQLRMLVVECDSSLANTVQIKSLKQLCLKGCRLAQFQVKALEQAGIALFKTPKNEHFA